MDKILNDYALAILKHRIMESNFNSLQVQKTGQDFNVQMNGQVLGVVGALGATITALSNACEFSLDELCTMVTLSTRIISSDETQTDEAANNGQFMGFLNNLFSEGGKN